MIESIQRWACERGYQVAWGSVDLIRSARSEILHCRNTRELDQELFQSELAFVADDQLTDGAASVVVVVKPSEACRISFDLGATQLETILPPTYLRYRPTFEELRQDLQAHALKGARVEHFTGPLKAVAARLGVVRYGRNNLTYAANVGSYLQLCGYLTDAHLPTTVPCEPSRALLDECDECERCRLACPTGAIRQDRVLLHAEQCLTFANETPGDWPAWVPQAAHNSLLGCLLCQRSCPANPPLPISDVTLRFSADETRALLDGDPRSSSRSEDGIRKKLAWLGQPYAEQVLGRNLRALHERRRRRTPPSQDRAAT
jgi:epoxyqueuosine reductase